MILGKLKSKFKSRRLRNLLGVFLACCVLSCLALGVKRWKHKHAVHLAIPRTETQDLAGPIGPVYPDPPGILIHHSDTPAKLHGVTFNAAALDRIAQQRGFSISFEGKTYHISYHYVILPDGTIETGRPEHCQGAHCPKYNNWLGICLIGDFHQKNHWWPSTPTDEQKSSLVTLCESLMSKYHIPPENVRRHRDVRETWCPGNRFPYHEIIHELREYAAIHPETRTGAHPFGMVASAAVTPHTAATH
jgi:hypothetical protein